MTAVALIFWIPNFHISPASERHFSKTSRNMDGPTAGIQKRAEVSLLPMDINRLYIQSHSKNGIFSGRLEGNCQEFSEKTIFLMGFNGIYWH
jgi:hypothetical protein